MNYRDIMRVREMITKNEIDRFMTHIENGYLVWKVKLKGDE